MGKILKARNNAGFGMFRRAMNVKDAEVKAQVLQKAALKLAEYRDANVGLARENERLKITLDAALRRIAELTDTPYPPVAETQQ